MSHSRNESLAAEKALRANAYKLLSECFQPPEVGLEALIEEAADEEFPVRIDPALIEDLRTLRVDHAKLFVGPFELLAPPYGSIYVDDAERVMTESTLAVERRYRQEGLDVGLDEPADHVAAELEFVYYLVVKELEALADGDRETAADYRRKQRSFLETHLGVWMDEFAENVEEHADTEFYRTVARETAAFVADERTRLAEESV